jgi:uncharacterized protein DUF4154
MPLFAALFSRPGKGFRVALFAACAFLCAVSLGGEQNAQLSEDQIKTGFLFNFTKFVQWPADAYADANAPIVLGIAGESSLSKLLAEVAEGKSIDGRAVVIKNLKEGQSLRSCQILFVSASEERHLPQILEELKGTSVLTVGEAGGFVQGGGMINFFIEGNKVKLEMNLDATTRGRLKISAKLIAVARLITVDVPPGKY